MKNGRPASAPKSTQMNPYLYLLVFIACLIAIDRSLVFQLPTFGFRRRSEDLNTVPRAQRPDGTLNHISV